LESSSRQEGPQEKPGSSEELNRLTPRKLWLILGLLVSAQFAVVVDYSIVQISLPTIRDQLAISVADSQWIISAYGLTFAGLLLLSGRLSDIYGRKNIFLFGLLVFTASSLAAGLASSEAVLISSRIVQGIGAALASAAGLALITRIYGPLGRLNQALGIFTAVSSAGFAAGVLLGGILTEALGWRWIFFVNVPVGILATVFSSRTLPALAAERSARHGIDLPGAFSVTAGLMLLVYGLSEVGNGDASALTYGSFLLAGLMLAAFVVIERRSPSPVVPLGFLGRRTVFLANATALLTFATTVPWIFLLASYFQVLLSYSPVTAAEAMVPGALVFFTVGGFAAPRLVKRLGAKPVLVGAMATLSTGLLLTSRLSAGSSYVTEILPTILVAALGGALSATASNIAALEGIGQGEEGVASGLINTSRQVGGPIGLAVVVSVLGFVTRGQGFGAYQGEVTAAFQYSFMAAAAFAALAVLTSLLLKGKATPILFEQPLEMPLPQIPARPSVGTSPSSEPVYYSTGGRLQERGLGMSAYDKEVTTMVIRRIKSGQELEYANWFGRIKEAIKKSPGFRGMTVIVPGDKDPGTRIIMYRFADIAAMENWENSAAREEFISEVNEHAGQIYGRAGGMETWFSLPANFPRQTAPA
jgi:EmrB/QacA subfamily drug resistance transporter